MLRACTDTTSLMLGWNLFLLIIRYAQFSQTVTQSVAGEPEQAGSLALIAVGAAQRFADHLIFPLLQRHPFGQKRGARIRCSRRAAACGRVQMDVSDVEQRA